MAASSSFFALTDQTDALQKHVISQQHSSASAASAMAPPAQNPRKRRNQPGNPSPDAEVIALSPETLMATNRFMCEVCNKGFQREQNLQLHRRGHNLPWKLRQKTAKEQQEVRRKVYLCPEPTCIHHDPSRALGDLTGIKKHFSRKHGEKRFTCDKCNKKYAVQSDCKAHAKLCGTKEYKCDCGTIFSRRDSFVTHRAFCDALAQETARVSPRSLIGIGFKDKATISLGLSSQLAGPLVSPDPTPVQPPALSGLRGVANRALGNLLGQSMGSAFRPIHTLNPTPFFTPADSTPPEYHEDTKDFHAQYPELQNHGSNASSGGSLFGFNFPSAGDGVNVAGNNHSGSNPSLSAFAHPFAGGHANENSDYDHRGGSSHFSGLMNDASLYNTSFQTPNMATHLSATALLQKAAQLGSTSSHAALLKSYGSSSSSAGGANSGNFSGIFGESCAGAAGGFQEMLNSIAASGGGSSVFGSGSYGGGAENANEYEGYNGNGMIDLEQAPCKRYREDVEYGIQMEQNTVGEGNFGSENIGVAAGSDGLTRDFLGVGELVRKMSGEMEHEDLNPADEKYAGGAMF